MELSSHLDLNPLKRLPPLEVLSSAAHLARQEVIWSLSMLEDLPPLPGAPNKMGRTSDSGIWKSYLQEWLAGEHHPRDHGDQQKRIQRPWPGKDYMVPMSLRPRAAVLEPNGAAAAKMLPGPAASRGLSEPQLPHLWGQPETAGLT